MATYRSRISTDPDIKPILHVSFGNQIPEHVMEKAAPFALGMLTTYVLQLLMPAIAYYTSVTTQFLIVALIWLTVSAGICWYFGVFTPEMSGLQLSITTVMFRFSQKPLNPLLSSTPDLSFPQDSKFYPGSRSPQTHQPPRSRSSVRDLKTGDLPELPSIRKPSSSGNSHGNSHGSTSPTINVWPFLVPIRDGTRRTQSDLLIPQQSLGREESERSILRAFANPHRRKRPSFSGHSHDPTDTFMGVFLHPRRNKKVNEPLSLGLDSFHVEKSPNWKTLNTVLIPEDDRANLLAR